MNVFEQIENIYSGENESKPAWANDMLAELQEIKRLLQSLNRSQPTPSEEWKPSAFKQNDYYTFVNQFRKSLQPNTATNYYPTFIFKGRKLGVNFKGWLYDKQSTKPLSKQEAFAVYSYAYSQHKTQEHKI